MFYCNPCGHKNGWPTNALLGSHGPCEVCEMRTRCNDVPSSRLPKARGRTDDDGSILTGLGEAVSSIVESTAEIVGGIFDE